MAGVWGAVVQFLTGLLAAIFARQAGGDAARRKGAEATARAQARHAQLAARPRRSRADLVERLRQRAANPD